MPLTLLDDFNRADGPLGSNWVAPVGQAAAIVSNQALFSSGDEMTWLPSTYGPDAAVSVSIQSISASNVFIQLWVIGIGPPTLDSPSGYYVHIRPNISEYQLHSAAGASHPTIATLSAAPSPPFTLTLRYESGVLSCFYDDVLAGSVRDTTQRGVGNFRFKNLAAGGDVTIDDFRGQTLYPAPSQPITLGGRAGSR